MRLESWHRLPRDARDTLFQLGVIAWTVLPHAAHLPLWCSLLCATILLWRGRLAINGSPLPPRWNVALPGGGVERYERLEEAVQREAREESGAQVTVLHLLGVYDRLGQGVSNYIGVFVCAPLSEPNPPRSLEIAEARYFMLDALPEGLDPGSRRRIAEYAAGERGLARDW